MQSAAARLTPTARRRTSEIVERLAPADPRKTSGRARRKGTGPAQRPADRVAHEQRLDGEVVTQRRNHRGDLHHLAAERVGVAADDVVAVDVDDDVERLGEDLAHDALGDVLARHRARR